jgi:hypothetical protein
VNEIDVLVAGAVGGFISAAFMMAIAIGQLRFAYEHKLKTLQMQIVALQVAVGGGNE